MFTGRKVPHELAVGYLCDRVSHNESAISMHQSDTVAITINSRRGNYLQRGGGEEGYGAINLFHWLPRVAYSIHLADDFTQVTQLESPDR